MSDLASRVWLIVVLGAVLTWFQPELRDMALPAMLPTVGTGVICAAFAGLLLNRPWKVVAIWGIVLLIACWGAATLLVGYLWGGPGHVVEAMVTGLGFALLPTVATVLLIALSSRSKVSVTLRVIQAGVGAVALAPLSALMVLWLIFVIYGDGV